MRVLSTLAIRAGLLVVTLPKCAKWLIGDSFLFRSEMCESRSLVGEGAELPRAARRVRGDSISNRFPPLTRLVARSRSQRATLSRKATTFTHLTRRRWAPEKCESYQRSPLGRGSWWLPYRSVLSG